MSVSLKGNGNRRLSSHLVKVGSYSFTIVSKDARAQECDTGFSGLLSRQSSRGGAAGSEISEQSRKIRQISVAKSFSNETDGDKDRLITHLIISYRGRNGDQKYSANHLPQHERLTCPEKRDLRHR